MGVCSGQHYLPEPLKKQLCPESKDQTVLSSIQQAAEDVAKNASISFTDLYRSLYWYIRLMPAKRIQREKAFCSSPLLACVWSTEGGLLPTVREFGDMLAMYCEQIDKINFWGYSAYLAYW